MHRLISFCGVISLLGLAVASAPAAHKKKPPDDTAPQLLSTQGGGVTWKNATELRQRATQGDAQACFALGTRLLTGDDEIPAEPAAALPWLEKAAAGGVADASFRLGKNYHDGFGVPRDYSRALDYYLEASQQGVAEAQHNIGAMLVSARGVKRNYIEGLAWLIVAGKSGAVSQAEIQVRDLLAKRPNDIHSAEVRAAEIIADVAHATVLAIRTGRSTNPQPLSPPVITNPVVKPVIVTPSIPTPASAKITAPIIPVPPSPPPLGP